MEVEQDVEKDEVKDQKVEDQEVKAPCIIL